jgi:hypothetical protein
MLRRFRERPPLPRGLREAAYQGESEAAELSRGEVR